MQQASFSDVSFVNRWSLPVGMDRGWGSRILVYNTQLLCFSSTRFISLESKQVWREMCVFTVHLYSHRDCIWINTSESFGWIILVKKAKKGLLNTTNDSLIWPHITSFRSPKPNSHWMWPHPLQTADNKLSLAAAVTRSLHLFLFPPIFRLPVGVYSYVNLGMCVSAILSIQYVHLNLQCLLHNNLI